MKKLLAVVAVLVFMISAVACNNTEKKEEENKDDKAAATEVMQMKGQELVDLLSDAEKAGNTMVVDVRKADEFTKGHIEGAVNIALEDIEAKLSDFEAYKDKTIVLYCNTGNRSGKAAALLMEKGYNNIYNAEGVKQFEYKLVTE